MPFAALVLVAALLGAASFAGPGAAATGDGVAGGTNGLVVLMRHALAPGIGDPPGFRLDECATQRNLDDDGRNQARRIGDRLRELGIARARVFSSPWCRCLDTARLLDLGPVTVLPALGSFFGRPEEKEARTADLRAFLAGLDPAGPPVVLVGHQVTVAALTGAFPSSGEGVLLRADGTPHPPVLGRIADPIR